MVDNCCEDIENLIGRFTTKPLRGLYFIIYQKNIQNLLLLLILIWKLNLH
jgi:hypothetical protein